MWVHQTMPLEATDVMRLSMTQSKVHTWFHYPQTPPNWNHPTSTEHLVYEIHLRRCDFLEQHVFHSELHTHLPIVLALETITILHITHSFPPVIWTGTSMQSKCTLIPVNKCGPKVQLCVVTEHTVCSLQVLIPHHKFITKTSEYISQRLFKPNFLEQISSPMSAL